MADAQILTLNVEGAGSVSALWLRPVNARACYVLAHGAGAGMTHPFLEQVSAELSERGIATLRFQFPFMEHGSRRPDRPDVAHAAVRAAVAEAGRLAPDLALVAGGRSFGGRMTSQAQAASPLPGVQGLAFLGFPLHPAGRPSSGRGRHLSEVTIPMLFLQGTRDALADLQHLRPLCEELGSRAGLQLFQDADHSFHVPVRSGRTDDQVREEIMDAFVAERRGDPAPRARPCLMPDGTYPKTPDGRYFLVRGRLWRRSNPHLDEPTRQALVRELMTGRRDVRDAKQGKGVLAAARARVDAAKRALGERGPPWWTDGAPDYNRRMVANTPYAAWFAALAMGRAVAEPHEDPDA